LRASKCSRRGCWGSSHPSRLPLRPNCDQRQGGAGGGVFTLRYVGFISWQIVQCSFVVGVSAVAWGGFDSTLEQLCCSLAVEHVCVGPCAQRLAGRWYIPAAARMGVGLLAWGSRVVQEFCLGLFIACYVPCSLRLYV
jgi:hypothetical protein